jgi:cation transport ATPase
VFERLARTDLIVLEDSPALRRGELDVDEIHSRVPEPTLLRYAASAFRHFADDRAAALAHACREREIHLLDLEPVAFEPAMTVVHGGRRVAVRDHGMAMDPWGPLVVEVDGSEAGVIRFKRSRRSAAAAAIRRIKSLANVPVVLISDRPESDVAALAANLGVDYFRAGLRPNDTADYLNTYRQRGRRTVFVGDCGHEGCPVADVNVSLREVVSLDSDRASVVLLHDKLELFADLWEIGRLHQERVRSIDRFILWPNILCVAGAFFLGATALTAVVITNLGTSGTYNRALGALRALNVSRPGQPRRTALGS